MNLEEKDLELIALKVTEALKPHLKPCGKHEGEDVIFTIETLSQYLSVSKKWIYEQTSTRSIPHFKLTNKQLRFRKKEIDGWIDSLKRIAINEPTTKLRLIK